MVQLAPASDRYEIVPLLDILDDPARETLQRYIDRIKTDFPHHEPFSIMVMRRPADTDANVASAAPSDTPSREEMAYRSASRQLPVFQTTKPVQASYPPGIYVIDEVIARQTPQELVGMLIHELGHHYLDHGQRKDQVTHTLPTYPRYDPRTQEQMIILAKINRAAECEADHFAAHYMPEHQGSFVSGTRRILEHSARSLGWQEHEIDRKVTETMNTEFVAHPAITERTRLLADDALRDLKPGTVKFDARCRVTDNSPLPALAKVEKQAVHQP